jgi:hypothetical protein
MLPQPNNDDEACIKEPVSFFDELGNLHDADVNEFQWNPFKREIAIAIDDLYANFLDLPEYDRLQPVRLIMCGVSRVQIDVRSDGPPLRIKSLEVYGSSPGPQIHITVMFDHAGNMQIDCDSVACRPHR